MANCLLNLAFLNLAQAVYRVYRLELTDIPSHSFTGRDAKSINFGRGQNFRKFSSDSGRDVSIDVITTCIRTKPNSIHVSFKLLPIETLLKTFYESCTSRTTHVNRSRLCLNVMMTSQDPSLPEDEENSQKFLKIPEFH